MPNHVTTRLTMAASPETINKIKTFIVKDGIDGDYLDFNLIIPEPNPLPENWHSGNLNYCSEGKLDNWYGWHLKYWGTKWNSYGFKSIEETDTTLDISFQTAWSIPSPVIQKLIDMFPDLCITLNAFDEMWNFAIEGQYNPYDKDMQITEFREEEKEMIIIYELTYNRKYIDYNDDAETEASN